MSGEPKRYSPEFKEQAAKKVIDNSLPIAQGLRTGLADMGAVCDAFTVQLGARRFGVRRAPDTNNNVE
jgi:hypothetical protein